MTIRLGDLLVRRGVLTARQRDHILEVQASCGRPFGALAESLFNISPSAVEQAWARQYAMLARHVDPRLYHPSGELLELVSRRQAWQFGVLPLARTPAHVTLCTTELYLARALRFAGWRIPEVCDFVLSEPDLLGQALEYHYSIDGLSAGTLAEGGLHAA
ncbi:MAG: hypothetical protein IT439_03355 [Phycisphaerales bacterium]|nr:hypothetical protein [Phycisphaerales bacterium]